MSQIETRRELTRAEVADYLREFADELDVKRSLGGTADAGHTTSTSADDEHRSDTTAGSERTSGTTADDERGPTNDPNASATSERTTYEKVTILVGNDSATVNPPETVDFEVAVHSDSSLMESGERQRVSFVMEWDAREVDDAADDLEII